MRGTIKHLSARGFGFIAVSSSADVAAHDYFFHLADLENRRFGDLRVGDSVEFIVGTNGKSGRLAAEQVNVV